jgi:hypothetical protein
MGEECGRKTEERDEVVGKKRSESLLNWSHLSYKSRGFQIGALAGVR